jgi:hypothetical protein
MKRLFWRLAPEMVLCLAIAGMAGCSDPVSGTPSGPPVLNSWSVVDNATGGSLDITSDGGPVQVSGFVHLNALFDRLLDPTTVTMLVGGVDQGTSDAITIATTPALPAGASLTVNTIYTPNGGPIGLIFPLGPSLATSVSPTFPSGSTITATMDKTKVRSKKGEPFTATGDLASGKLMFQTLPFSVSITVPMADPDPDAGAADAGPPPVSPMMQAVTLAFTNVPTENIKDFITVTVNGAAYTDFGVAPEGNPTMVDVTPTATWPANATIVVSVSAAATDALGGAIDSAASNSFTTSGM